MILPLLRGTNVIMWIKASNGMYITPFNRERATLLQFVSFFLRYWIGQLCFSGDLPGPRAWPDLNARLVLEPPI